MKYLKLLRLRPADRPLRHVPDVESRVMRSERNVPHPAHLNFR